MKYLNLLLAFSHLNGCFVTAALDVKCNDVCKCVKNKSWYIIFSAHCPTDVEMTFDYHSDDLDVVIKCHKPQADLSVLSGITLNGTYRYGKVSIEGCYLPNSSISDLLASKGITNYHSLYISSYNGSLERKHFENLQHVYNVKISESKLGVLPADVFVGLPQLSKLVIDLSSFSLSKGVFQFLRPQMLHFTRSECNNYDEVFDLLRMGSLKRLEIVGTNASALQLRPRQFADMMNMELVVVSGMKLKSVPEDAFSGSMDFDRIDLSNNLLTSLKENTFSDLRFLEILNLSHNKISHLPEQLFSRTTRLWLIDLSYNLLETIEPNLFSNLNKLVHLILSHNKLRYICGEEFSQLTSVRSIDLSHNQLISLAQDPLLSDLDRSVFYNCTQLEDLYLQNNSLTELYDDWRPQLTQLYELNISSNDITDLQTFNFAYDTISTGRKDVRPNYVDVDNIIDISNNPLNCGCDLVTSFYNFSRYFTKENTSFDKATCKTPTRLEKVKLKEIDWPMEYERCKQQSSEKDKKCPEGCRCVYRPLTRSSVINCQYSDLQTYPWTLPVAPDANHTELNLYGNRLREFRLPDDPGYKNVTFLNLANNSLSALDISGASKGLKKLDLRHNNLSTLSEETLELLENAGELERLELADNPWNCDLSNYYLARLVRIKNNLIHHSVKCADGSPIEKILDLNNV